MSIANDAPWQRTCRELAAATCPGPLFKSSASRELRFGAPYSTASHVARAPSEPESNLGFLKDPQ